AIDLRVIQMADEGAEQGAHGSGGQCADERAQRLALPIHSNLMLTLPAATIAAPVMVTVRGAPLRPASSAHGAAHANGSPPHPTPASASCPSPNPRRRCSNRA